MYFEGTKMSDTSNKRSGTSTTNESSLTACRVPRSLRIVGASKCNGYTSVSLVKRGVVIDWKRSQTI